MVFIVVAKDYIGFPMTRLALIAQDDGQIGELRLTDSSQLLFRVYQPNDIIQCAFHWCIPTALIDGTRSYMVGCDVRIVTLNGYEFWFRFISDACSVVFSIILESYDNIGDGVEYLPGEIIGNRQANQWFLFAHLAECRLLLVSNRFWCEPWTRDEVDLSREYPSCRCDQVDYTRYTMILTTPTRRHET